MNWLAENWQSLAAPAVVAATAGVFMVRLLRRPKKSCGGSCNCGK
jgi:hypothetical protein